MEEETKTKETKKVRMCEIRLPIGNRATEAHYPGSKTGSKINGGKSRLAATKFWYNKNVDNC